MAQTTGKQIALLREAQEFPSTRYQGSKLKIVEWIWENVKDLKFRSVLDGFGGTGSVAYMFKQKGKKVTYNDILKFNYHIGIALIENGAVVLTADDLKFLLSRHESVHYPSFVEEIFRGIYFTDEENRWIDTVVTNIQHIGDAYKKAIAYYALFQTCIIKRPFNLFHRKNLYIRFSKVERNFGNKVTWDTPFEIHFEKFVDEANAAIFSNGEENRALNTDVFNIEGDFDLVYIDPPYISSKGIGVDYLGFYHFLEGLVNYHNWGDMIDYRSKHRRVKVEKSVWTDRNQIHTAFDRLFEKFQDSILIVSYRSDGIPSIEYIVETMKRYKSRVQGIKRKGHKYVLSTNETQEVLVIRE